MGCNSRWQRRRGLCNDNPANPGCRPWFCVYLTLDSQRRIGYHRWRTGCSLVHCCAMAFGWVGRLSDRAAAHQVGGHAHTRSVLSRHGPWLCDLGGGNADISDCARGRALATTGAGVRAAAMVGGGAAQGATGSPHGRATVGAYDVDMLFRSAHSDANPTNDGHAEAMRI